MKKTKIEKLKQGQKAAIVSIAVSFVLAIVKATVGFLSGAVVLITDALDSAADILSSLAAFFGLKISQKKPDDKFPYGYYKAENFASLFISGLIIYGAATLMIKGYERLFTISEISYPYITLTVVVIAGIVAFFMSRYLKKKGEQINSQSLIANSKDRLKDVFVAIIVFLAILLTFLKVPYVEGIITIIIAILIIRMGLLTAKDAIFALMDVSPSKDIEQKAEKIIKSIKGVEDFKDLRLRKAGPFIFGEVKVKIKKFVDVNRAHEISEKIENKIKQRLPQIESFSVHIEPYKTQKQTIVIPIKQNRGLNSEVIPHFGRAAYFMFVTIDKDKVVNKYVKKNPHKNKKVRAGLAAAHFIAKQKADSIVTKEIGEISFHTLRDHLIDIYITKGKTAKTVVNNFVKNKLKRLRKPTRRKD